MCKLSSWIALFENGLYDAPDRSTQIKAGWYDWFCRDTSLAQKTKRMGNIVKQITKGGKVDLEKNYVWFKNNCPLNGNLYDDFRIADMETRNVIFTIQIDCCCNEKRYTVYGNRNDFKEPMFETDSSKELVKWFNEGWVA
jgi:hypothetical protein